MGKIFRELNYLLERGQKLNLLYLGVLIFIGGLLETLSVTMMLPVVGVILDPQAMEKYQVVGFLRDTLGLKSQEALASLFLVALMVIYILKNLYLLYLTWEQTRFIAYNRNRMISKVLREFLNRPYEFYLEADIPTIFRMTDADIPQVFNMLLDLIQLTTELVVAAALSIVLILTDWQMTAFLLGVVLVITLGMSRILKPRLNRLGTENLKIQSRIAKWRIEAIYGIKDVKVLDRTEFFASHYEESGKVGAGVARKYAVLNALPRLIIETFFICAILLYILIVLLSGHNAADLVTKLSVFGAAAIRLMPSVNRINTYYNNIAYEQPCLDFLYENMDPEKLAKVTGRPSGAGKKVTPMKLEEEISLNGITYAYPGTDKLIFDRAGMKVPCGRSVGIMGASGAGKSTLVDILLGLLKLREGEITSKAFLKTIPPGLRISVISPSPFTLWTRR